MLLEHHSWPEVSFSNVLRRLFFGGSLGVAESTTDWKHLEPNDIP